MKSIRRKQLNRDSAIMKGLALASLSGESDAEWASKREEWIDLAFLGGIALDAPTREAARSMVERGRNEFITESPYEWIRNEFRKLEETQLTPGINVRASSPEPIERAGEVVSEFDGILEINAHCRQPEMIEAGCGHALLRSPEILKAHLNSALKSGVKVSVKVRFEVPGADTVSVVNELSGMGCDYLHVDTMDSPERLGQIESGNIIANNGIRTPEDLAKMKEYGADYVSVARGDSPAVLRLLRDAIDSSLGDAELDSETLVQSN